LKLKNEQEDFIAQLYHEMYSKLCIYAMNALKDRELAEEAVQDTFCIACMKVNSLISSDNPQGWITLTLKNVIRNIIKSRSRMNSLIISALSIEDIQIIAPEDDMEFNVIYSDLLNKEDFKLLMMIVIDKYTMLEASEELGISIEACKKRVQRAKNKLKKIIEEKLQMYVPNVSSEYICI